MSKGGSFQCLRNFFDAITLSIINRDSVVVLIHQGTSPANAYEPFTKLTYSFLPFVQFVY